MPSDMRKEKRNGQRARDSISIPVYAATDPVHVNKKQS